MLRTLHRLITSVSVNTRVVVLAAIPVTGFLINGIAFAVGQPSRRTTNYKKNETPTEIAG